VGRATKGRSVLAFSAERKGPNCPTIRSANLPWPAMAGASSRKPPRMGATFKKAGRPGQPQRQIRFRVSAESGSASPRKADEEIPVLRPIDAEPAIVLLSFALPVASLHDRFGSICTKLEVSTTSPLDAQVFSCHHPNIATKRHATKILIWMPICIQYWTGAASL